MGGNEIIMTDKKKHPTPWPVYVLVTATLAFSGPIFTGDVTSRAFAGDIKDTQPAEPEGNIYNLYGRVMGSVDKEGNVTNAYGRTIGWVNSDGVIINVSKIFIGQVTADGHIQNQSGTVLGSVNSSGDILNVSARKVGEVKDIENIKLIGGAARLLFLK
jgi:hypothetical protein